MAKESNLNNFIVGAVFLGSLGLLGVATFIVKGMPFAEAQAITIRFDDINGLRKGEKLRVHGYDVGEVTDIGFDFDSAGIKKSKSEGAILVSCTVKPGVGLTKTTTFTVRSSNPLGGRYVQIELDPAGLPWNDESEFKGQAGGDLFERLEVLVNDLGGRGDATGLFPRLVRDEKLAAKAENMLEEIRQTFANLNEKMKDGKGLLPRLLNDEELAIKVEDVFGGLGTTLNSVNSEEGLMTDLQGAAKSLRSLTADAAENKDSLLHYVISDSEARSNLQSALKDLSAAAEKLHTTKEGLLGKLLNDPELSENVEETLANFHTITDKINQGEGTLPKLLNDPEAWDEVMRLLVLARESLEDLREQAPINTFANVLFAAF